MSDDTKHRILKGIGKGLGELGFETLKKTREQGEEIFESVITGKELLGLDNTMSEGELDFERHKDAQNSADEINKIRGEVGKNKDEEKKQTEKRRDVEGEMEQLRNQKEKEEEDKEKYYAEEKRRREMERQRQEEEYNNSLMTESTNPSKQKKSRGSALVHKKKHQPDQSQMSQTQEFKGKID